MRKIKLMLTLGLLTLGFLSLISCVSRPKSPQPEKCPQRVIGNAKDAHGCLVSAGYQWSELLKDCIRPWEKGVKLSPVHKDINSFAAYLVFNADSSRVELFLPERDDRPILKRKQEKDHTVWSNRKRSLTVQRIDGVLSITEHSEVIFREE